MLSPLNIPRTLQALDAVLINQNFHNNCANVQPYPGTENLLAPTKKKHTTLPSSCSGGTYEAT